MKITIRGYQLFDSRLLIIVVLALLCAYGKYSQPLSIIVGIAELLILLEIIIVEKSFRKYMFSLLIFASTALSNSTFMYNDASRQLYTLFKLPIIQGYHTTILYLLPFMTVLWRFDYFKKTVIQNKALYNMFRFVFCFFFIGLFMTLFTVLINDNNILDLQGFTTILIRRNILKYINLLILVLDITYLFVSSDEVLDEFAELGVLILKGVGIASIISVLLGWSADYGSGTTLLMSQSAFFVVLLLILPLYDNKEKTCWVIGVLSTFALLVRSSELGGKWWLIVFFVFGILIVQVFNTRVKQPIYKLFAIVFVFGGIAFIAYILTNEQGFGLAETKLHQAVNLLHFSSKNWYALLPASPKTRIEEFVNIWIALLQNPIYLMFGKGFLGTVTHSWGQMNWVIMEGGFSEIESQAGIFANMHECVNTILLTSGLMGLFFVIKEIKYFIKNFREDFWCVIGFIWFIFFFTDIGYVGLWLGLFSWIYSKCKINKRLNSTS